LLFELAAVGSPCRWDSQTLTLFEAHRRFILGCRVLHADETPVPLLGMRPGIPS